MSSENVKRAHEVIQQGRRRYQAATMNDRGTSAADEPGDENDEVTGTNHERPGAEKPILRPWTAVPKRNKT